MFLKLVNFYSWYIKCSLKVLKNITKEKIVIKESQFARLGLGEYRIFFIKKKVAITCLRDKSFISFVPTAVFYDNLIFINKLLRYLTNFWGTLYFMHQISKIIRFIFWNMSYYYANAPFSKICIKLMQNDILSYCTRVTEWAEFYKWNVTTIKFQIMPHLIWRKQLSLNKSTLLHV